MPYLPLIQYLKESKASMRTKTVQHHILHDGLWSVHVKTIQYWWKTSSQSSVDWISDCMLGDAIASRNSCTLLPHTLRYIALLRGLQACQQIYLTTLLPWNKNLFSQLPLISKFELDFYFIIVLNPCLPLLLKTIISIKTEMKTKFVN